MLPLSGLAPLALGITVMLTLLIRDRWKLTRSSESPWGFYTIFGVVPIVYGVVKSFTDDFALAVRCAMVAALLAAVAVAVQAVVRRRFGGLREAALIAALALPLGLGFAAVFQKIQRPPAARASTTQGVVSAPCTAKVLSAKKTGRKVEGKLIFNVTVAVTGQGRVEQRHKLVEELHRAQYERFKQRGLRYQCLMRLDAEYVEVFWDKLVRPSAGASAAATPKRS